MSSCSRPNGEGSRGDWARSSLRATHQEGPVKLYEFLGKLDINREGLVP